VADREEAVRRAALVASLALLALASAAQAGQPGWSDPFALGDTPYPWNAAFTNRLAVTSQGDAIAMWDSGAGMKLSIKPAGGSIATETVPTGGDVAADALGNAYLAYVGPDGDVSLRVRPPGGAFGAPETIETPDASYPRLAVAPDGDVAVVWAGSDSAWAAFKPSGGSLGPPVKLVDGNRISSWAGQLDAALSANGDLAVVYVPFRETSEPPGRVTAVVRTASGDVELAALGEGLRRAVQPSVAIDDAGRAVAVWSEADEGATRAVYYAQRAAGEGFGARLVLHRTRVYSAAAASSAAMSRDGHFTLSAPARLGRRLYVGQAGGPAKKLRSYYENPRPDNLPLAASPNGAHVLQAIYASTRVMTALRSGSGAFEPMQDLRRDCGDGSGSVVAVGDSGQTAALVTELRGPVVLLVGDQVSEQRACLNIGPGDDQNTYLMDPYAPAPQGGPAAGGTWEPGAPAGGRPPPSAQPFGLGMPSLQGTGTLRRARVVIVCPKECETTAAVSLRFGEGGAVLATGTRSRSAPARPAVLDVPVELTAADAKKVDAALKKRPKTPLLLKVKVTATDAKGKKRSRAATTVLSPPF
jgi:hypothetical protein